MKIENFLNEEVVDFASYSTLRAIASLVDGFKNSGRKVAFTTMKRGPKETKVSILAGIVAIECLEYNTKINLEDGSQISIGDWATKYPDKKLNVLSVDEYGNSVIGVGHSARETRKTNELYHIQIDDELVTCTDNHRFMVKTEGKPIWVQAKDLKEGDEIISYK